MPVRARKAMARGHADDVTTYGRRHV